MTVQKYEFHKKLRLAVVAGGAAFLVSQPVLAEQPEYETVVVGGKARASVEVNQDVLDALGPPRPRSSLRPLPTPWDTQPFANNNVSYQPVGAPQAVEPTGSYRSSGAPALVTPSDNQVNRQVPLSDLDWQSGNIPADNIEVIPSPSGKGRAQKSYQTASLPQAAPTPDVRGSTSPERTAGERAVDSRYLEMARARYKSQPSQYEPGKTRFKESTRFSGVPTSKFKEAEPYRSDKKSRFKEADASRIPEYHGPGTGLPRQSSYRASDQTSGSSSLLTSGEKASLIAAAARHKQSGRVIVISSSADNEGGSELSALANAQRRANAARDLLLSKGVSENQIETRTEIKDGASRIDISTI